MCLLHATGSHGELRVPVQSGALAKTVPDCADGVSPGPAVWLAVHGLVADSLSVHPTICL
jgi:hypothetical protein